jgi:hypothetical protein
MKVRAIHAFAGDGFSIKPGEIIEMPDDAAQRFIAAGAGVAGDTPTVLKVRQIPPPVDVKVEQRIEAANRQAKAEADAKALGTAPQPKPPGRLQGALKKLTGAK